MISSRDCEADLRDLASLDHRHRLDDMAAHARLNNVSVYPIMPAALSGLPTRRQTGGAFNPGAFARQDALRGLAEDTDGLAIVNTKDIEENLKHMMTSTSDYYLLSYTPANTTIDGKFRRISVKVKRPNTHVRARPGYVATTLNMTPAETATGRARRDHRATRCRVVRVERAHAGTLLVSCTCERCRGCTATARDRQRARSGSSASSIRNCETRRRGSMADRPRSPCGPSAVAHRSRAKSTSRQPALSAEFEFVTADARLAPGVYGVQLQLVAPRR